MKIKKVWAICFSTIVVAGLTVTAIQYYATAESVKPLSKSEINSNQSVLLSQIGNNEITLANQTIYKKAESEKDGITYQIDSEIMPQKNSSTILEKWNTYQDNDKNVYRLSKEIGFREYSSYEYDNNLLPPKTQSSASLDKNDITDQKIKDLLKETIPVESLIPDIDQYQIKSVDQSDFLSVTLNKGISKDLKDQIFVDIGSNGQIGHIGTYKTNLTEITDSQKSKFQQAFDQYLKSYKEKYDYYTCGEITYKRISDKIIANYPVIYHTKAESGEDLALGDLVSFAIDV